VKALVDCVLFDAEDMGDLPSIQAIPGGEAEQLLVGGAEPVEGPVEELDLEVEGVLGKGAVTPGGFEPGGQVGLASPTPVTIADHTIGDAEKPGS
jgi:hypothetical protein